jgi:phosphonate degradation associated HDIG domain protein
MSEDIVARIEALFETRGREQYGLSHVNQLEHALQAAWIAERAGDPPALVAAALLHDVGHLIHDLGEDAAAQGVDDRHEEAGSQFLEQWFGPDVTEPVRLHVPAKRYLCGTEPDYFGRLSPDSVLSLKLQGGPMSADEAAEFRKLPGWEEAVRLRRYDEEAKVAGRETPPIAHFLPVVRSVL